MQMMSRFFNSKSQPEPEEQRKHPRHEIPDSERGHYMTACLLETGARLLIRISDISEGGMRFRGPAAGVWPAKGPRLEAHVNISGQVLTLRGDIVWVESLRGGSEFVGGLRFFYTGGKTGRDLNRLLSDLYRQMR